MGSRSRAGRAVAATALAGVLAAACSPAAESPPEPTAGAGEPLAWTAVALPAGLSPVTLATASRAADDDTVVVGAIAPEGQRVRPRILAGPFADTLREVPVTPRSPYGFEARWFQLAVRGDRIEAVSGARGGAHANYRWQTWSGSLSGVAEQEQPFGVFGSYGAGDLVGVAYAGASPVVLGAWQSESTGLDIATWTKRGDRWARQPSTGTALGSTPEALLDARAVTPRGEGVLLAGSVTELADGSVTVTPSTWSSPGPSGPWTRRDLPRMGDSGISVAQAATCGSTECVLAGTTEGKLTMWRLTADTASQPPGIPAVAVPEKAAPLAPLTVGDDLLLVTATDTGSVVLRGRGDAWTTTPGPDGIPVSAALHDGELWVVTSDGADGGALWRARVT